MKSVDPIIRIETDLCWPEISALPLSRTERHVRLSRTSLCVVHVLRGVPAARIDVLVEQDPDERWPIVVEVSRKVGRYDGAERVSLALRARQPGMRYAPGGLKVTDGGDGWDVRVATDGGIEINGISEWSGFFPRLRCDLDPRKDIASIVKYQAGRYYSFLEIADFEWAGISAHATSMLAGDADLNMANRAAGRALYAHARASGWRKLTTRERKKVLQETGVKLQMWEPVSAVEAAWAEARPIVGEYTEVAARWGGWL